jgi:hypothetical protein
MSLSEFEKLREYVDKIIWALYHNGLSSAISKEEAERLFEAAARLIRVLSTPEKELLLLRTALILQASLAAEEPPLWSNISVVAFRLNGALRSPATEETAQLYALLLINCSVAFVCMGQEKNASATVRGAHDVLEGLSNIAPRWFGTVDALSAHLQTDPQRRVAAAREAISNLSYTIDASNELLAYVSKLAGEGDGKIREGGFMRFGRSRDAFFGVQDLFLFNG